MAQNGKIVSIDVGTTKVCTAIAKTIGKAKIKVVGIGISSSKGLRKGLVVNINEASESIRDSVRKAEQSTNYKVESAYVGVTGRHVTSINSRGVVAITHSDRVVRHNDLKRVLISAQKVKDVGDKRLLHVIPRSYAVDDQAGVKNPIGMHGLRLDVEAHIITAAVTSVQNLVKCIRSIGIDIEDLVLEPLASSEAVLTEDEKQSGVILADIGGDTTDIAVFRDGSLWHTSILPVAGYHITRDISLGLGLPFDIAEEMKRKYSSVMPIYESQFEADIAIPQEEHGVSYQVIGKILRTRVEEILKLILLEIPNAKDNTPAGLVLTGGGSKLLGIDTLGHDLLGLPVRIGRPKSAYGVSGTFMPPEYATAIGLLLWGAKSLREDRIPLSKRLLKKVFKSAPRAKTDKQKLDDNIQDFEKAKEYFQKNRSDIISKYNNRYIAITGNKIVDSDEVFSNLAERVYDKFGYRPIYIPKVTAKSSVIYLPSPRIRSTNK